MRVQPFLQFFVVLFVGIFVPANLAFADLISVTDLIGRRVTLKAPAQKVILGEGRYIAALGILDRDDPTKRLVGSLGEFKSLDPAGYGQYLKAFPKLAEVPLFGGPSADTVSVEKAIALKPDLAIFGKSGHGPSSRTKAIVEKIEAAGIPVVFIDFRDAPLVNTPKSMRLLGKLLDREIEAEEYIRFYESELAKVRNRLKQAQPRKPTVFIEVHVGRNIPCCFTMSEGLMGRFIDFAGGKNIAKDLVPGPSGTINLEHLIATQPEIYIGTAIGSPSTIKSAPKYIVLGTGVSADMARASLRRGLDRKGIADLNAVSSGNAHAIWHHFYNSPLNVVAVQAFAKWFHPDLFADLDPEETLRTLFTRFQAVPLRGVYWASLK
ncbi:MAG: ABC transporter substrate-binding protein [Hyphomicrobiaceae bacterium]|nr:ABC transporter substrate-binding protein [Hyphomicrobiaceae bacterium]